MMRPMTGVVVGPNLHVTVARREINGWLLGMRPVRIDLALA